MGRVWLSDLDDEGFCTVKNVKSLVGIGGHEVDGSEKGEKPGKEVERGAEEWVSTCGHPGGRCHGSFLEGTAKGH